MTSDQKVLVIAEHFQGEIISSTSKAINCASQISSQVDLLVYQMTLISVITLHDMMVLMRF